jgi:hypothetical protein
VTGPFALLALAGPLLLLAAASMSLASRGPLGWVAAAALLVAVGWCTVRLTRLLLRWWAGTKAPIRDVPPRRRV